MTGYDDAGERVETVPFEYPGDDPEIDPEARSRIRREVIVAMLSWLSGGDADAEQVGRRVLVLDHVLQAGNGGSVTCRELGRRLGVSHVHAWRLCNVLRRELPGLLASSDADG